MIDLNQASIARDIGKLKALVAKNCLSFSDICARLEKNGLIRDREIHLDHVQEIFSNRVIVDYLKNTNTFTTVKGSAHWR